MKSTLMKYIELDHKTKYKDQPWFYKESTVTNILQMRKISPDHTGISFEWTDTNGSCWNDFEVYELSEIHAVCHGAQV